MTGVDRQHSTTTGAVVGVEHEDGTMTGVDRQTVSPERFTAFYLHEDGTMTGVDRQTTTVTPAPASMRTAR